MVMIENPCSDLPDPLRGHSLFLLFPRTFTDLQSGTNSDDLESVHNFMRTKALISSDQHFDKANEIIQGGSELPGSKLGIIGASKNNNEAVTTCNNPQERRPALGRKRARFSLKPDNGQPSVSLEPSLDIDRLQDPEEFFSAFHKLEYAKEEIERQTGGNMGGKNEYNPSANPRRRRPSIYGREASYKHNYSSAILENDDTVIVSQETLQEDNLNTSKFVSQETSNVELEERELAGSVSNSEKIVGGLLDELLSKDIENLDGGGALSLLQERLHLKDIDLDKYIHDFGQVGKVDSMDLEQEPSIGRKALSDIQNMVSGSRENNPMKHKQVAENQNNSLASSTLPKRPSDPSSSPERCVSKSKSKSFHFSFSVDCDPSPAGSPTPEYLDRQSDGLCTRKELNIPEKLNSQVDDEVKNITCAALGSKTAVPGDILDSIENIGRVNASSKITYIDTRTNGSHGGLVDNNEGEHVGDILGEAVPSAQPNVGNDDSSRGHTANPVHVHGLIEPEKNVEDIQNGATLAQQVDIYDLTTENSIISQSRAGCSEAIVAKAHFMDRQPANAETGPEQQNEESPKSSHKDRRKAGRPRGVQKRKALSRRRSLAGPSEAIVAEDNFMDRQPTNAETGPEQQNEERPKSLPKDRSKASRPRGLQERKTLSRRQSLAAAGTCWKSGVRRSNRNKMKPLEYWKGERFLYGRVHDSLVTVIGVKCVSSPTNNGKERKFRVTSYVSDEHKELVDLAALH